MAYVVTAPLVISKKEDGADLYLYENSEVPEHVDSDELERLAALGLIADASASVENRKRAAKKPAAESN